jgi:hypothetical protein
LLSPTRSVVRGARSGANHGSVRRATASRCV